MTDIRYKEDLEKIFGTFYRQLLLDPEMNHIFLDVAKLDIDAHLPIIVSFWEQVLFGSGNYKGNVLKIHQDLNLKVLLKQPHFKLWLETLFDVVDAGYCGENCEILKTRALSISQVMQIKLGNF